MTLTQSLFPVSRNLSCSDEENPLIGAADKAPSGSWVWYNIPFQPYAVQEAMMRFIRKGLETKGKEFIKPVIAMEVPTGCGKTLALLSAVLQFQQKVRHLRSKEVVEYFRERHPWNSVQKNRKKNGRRQRTPASAGSNEEDWGPEPDFMQHFGCGTARGEKRTREHVNESRSSVLRQRFPAPPCTIIYATRTHAQLRQVTRELRRLSKVLPQRQGSYSIQNSPKSECGRPAAIQCPLRMNILGSRDHYCINATIQKAKLNHTLPLEGNNLGEVCDKLVSLHQCPCVEGYEVLAAKAIDGSGVGECKGDPVWDMEDLVLEGVNHQKCPYYAARDLIFYADITLCTYQYLLDPIIRHESRFEGALNNNSIIVFDEAHNVSAVCEEALSIHGSSQLFDEILDALHPIVYPSEDTTKVLSYPREFHFSDGHSLVNTFLFLICMFREIKQHFQHLVANSNPGVSSSMQYVVATNLVEKIKNNCVVGGKSEASHVSSKEELEKDFSVLFRHAYRVIFSLGVTFNPFDCPIHVLAFLKRWLMILRFLLRKPDSFALHAELQSSNDAEASDSLRLPELSNVNCDIRCLDGSLAFFHLLRSSYRVILASGTLTPFPHLSKSLGLRDAMWDKMIGDHVVPQSHYGVFVVSKTFRATAVRCTYTSLSSDAFLMDIAESMIFFSSKSMRKGGVVVMVPNYTILNKLFSCVKKVVESISLSSTEKFCCLLNASRIFVEPRQAAEMQDILERFKIEAQRKVAMFIGVYRGKSGEGLDFSDDMARMVICVGIPYRPVNSWPILAKRNFSGEEWYVDDAICAVNQAVGRCLRHANDYGSILLFDERYNTKLYHNKVSSWCRNALISHDDAPKLLAELQLLYAKWTSLNSLSTVGSSVSLNDSIEPSMEMEIKSVSLKSSLPVMGTNREKDFSNKKEPGAKKTDARSLCITLTEQQKPLRNHSLACAAVKLLYEQSADTKEVTPSLLRAGIEAIEENFFSPEL